MGKARHQLRLPCTQQHVSVKKRTKGVGVKQLTLQLSEHETLKWKSGGLILTAATIMLRGGCRGEWAEF